MDALSNRSMRAVLVLSVLAIAGSAMAASPAEDALSCPAGASDGECDEVQTRAAESFEAAGAIGKAIALRRALIARAGKDAGRAAPSLYHLGTDYARIAEFAQAAEALEQLAALSPTASEAPQALSDAILFRMGLGDEIRVAEDAARFRQAYGATRPDLAAKVAYAMAAHAAEQGDLPRAERELGASMSAIDRGSTSLRMQAHALYGRALAARSDPRAAAQYALVRELGPALKVEAGTANLDELRTYAKGLMALGDAVLFDADAKRATTTWPRLARYSGGTTDKELDDWIARTVTPWIAARSRAITALEPEYRKVLDIGISPPPRAVVDAASRVAIMWADAADELAKSAPTLARKSQRDKLAAAGAPLDAKAKPAALACVSYSVKLQLSDAASTACAAWLVKTHPREFPPLDELLLPNALRPGGGAPVIAPLAEP